MRNPALGGASVSLAGDNESSTPKTTESQRAKPSRQARWQAGNPQAVWAWQCLRSALKRGLISKEPCAVCGHERVDAHHIDYGRPLAVQWLCRRHHRAAHRKAAK